MKGFRFGLLDKKTGELYDAEIRIAKQTVGGKWVRVFQDALGLMLKHQLHGETKTVLLCLICSVGYQNQALGTGAVAKVLDLKQTNVSRAYRELVKAGFLAKDNGAYLINPLMIWKGTDRQLEYALDRWITIQSKTATIRLTSSTPGPWPNPPESPLSAPGAIPKRLSRRTAPKMGFEPARQAQAVDADGQPIPEE